MSKIAFLFPGQGSQTVGMGRELCETYPVAREIFTAADTILGRSISELCFHGSAESLQDTRNSQPAIMTTSIAMWQVFDQAGIKPDYLAGHSLGEYSALVAARAFDFETALLLIKERARLMAEADREGRGAMAAILGMERQTLLDCLSEASEAGKVEAANFNSPGQIVISGDRNGIERAKELIEQQGGKVFPLSVSGAFHSSFMKPAATEFKPFLEKIFWNEPQAALIANVTARPVKVDEISNSLYQQLYSSVLWEESLRFLFDQGVTTFVEIGPGKVLTGLTKKTLKGINLLNCENLESLKKALEILKEV